MKLKQDWVREFRNIWDSGPIDIDVQIACFVGKDEAGNTRNRMDGRKILGSRRAGRDGRYWAKNLKRTAACNGDIHYALLDRRTGCSFTGPIVAHPGRPRDEGV